MRKLILMACCVVAFGQDAPKFEIADVHVSPKSATTFARGMPVRNGRWEMTNASIVDLIRSAYGFVPDKILGGPSWLEMDRFDVIAKVPGKPSPEELNQMQQSLLAERFKLVVHKESRKLPTYALTVGKKPSMKEADGAGDTGCRIQTPPGAPTEGGIRLMMNGTPLTLGPGGTLQYSCRNMTMEAFAAGLGNMLGVQAGNNPVIDKTGLAGRWNFDVKWSLGINAPAAGDSADHITAFDALEKQLGLKVEQVQVETPVIVVDSVSNVPTPNSPEVAKELPPIPAPSAFDVADIKPSDPNARGSSMRVQANGTFTTEGTSLQMLLLRALNTSGNLPALSSDAVIGMPKFAASEAFNITAKAPAGGPQLTMITVSPLLRSLLEERFGLKTHAEERPLSAATLLAVKPKMRKADPASRTHCVRSNGAAGSPPGTQILTCQNLTMAQFAETLLNMGPGLYWPVLDSSGLEGGWDFTLTFNNNMGRQSEAQAQNGETAAASDPSGGYTLNEAIERQLGLKLEMQKRPEPVVVIDHLEEKPTDN